MRTFKVTVFQRTYDGSRYHDEMVRMWRGVRSFPKMFVWLDRNEPNWVYINVYGYSHEKGVYLGRVYSNTRNYRQFY